MRNRMLMGCAAVVVAALGLGCTGRSSVVPKSSGSIALSPDDALVFVADADHDALFVIDAKTQAVVAQTPVGRQPERVAVSTAGDVYVTSRGARTVSKLSADGRTVLATATVGAEPVGLALSPDGKELFVANAMSGTVTRLDAASLAVREELAVGGQPYAVAPLADGKTLYVTDFATGGVDVVALDSKTVVHTETLEQPPEAECQWGLAPVRTPAQAADVVLSPDGERAYVAHVQSRTGLTDAQHPNGAWQSSLAFAVAPALSTMDTQTHTHRREPAASSSVPMSSDQPVTPTADFPATMLTTNLDQNCATVGRAPGMDSPSSLVVDGLGDWVFVADHNSNAVAVVSTSRRVDSRFSSPERGIAGVVRVGARPTGIAVTGDLKRAYVHNALDGTVSVLENVGGTLSAVATVPFTTSNLPADVERGRRLFFSAVDPRVTAPELGGVSCSSCHPDGRTDNLTWRLPSVPSAPAAGTQPWWSPTATTQPPRNTPPLWGVTKTAPYHWEGTTSTLGAYSTGMAQQMGGVGVSARDVADLTAFMSTITLPDNPNAGRTAPGLLERGKVVFAERCASCHAGEQLTSGAAYPVPGTDVALLDTPSLRGVFATKPYLHDGSAQTLRDVLRPRTVGLTQHDLRSVPLADLEAVEAFVNAQ